MKKEIWIDVLNYEGIYQVSNLGKIKSLDRIDSIGRNIKGKILIQCKGGNDYLKIALYKNGKFKNKYIHSLIYRAFNGEIPEGYDIDHHDNDKYNNIPENLKPLNRRNNVTKGFLRKKTSSKYIGVYWNKNEEKWRASIYIKDNQIHLGYFNIEEDTRDAYNNKLKEITNGK